VFGVGNGYGVGFGCGLCVMSCTWFGCGGWGGLAFVYGGGIAKEVSIKELRDLTNGLC
jgi:hypothetical protein